MATMRAEVAQGREIAPAVVAETARSVRPLWQVALAAWLGQRLLIGALVVGWQLLLGTFSPAAFYRVWTLFDGIFYTLIAQYGYRILLEAAYFPLYPLLMHVTAPLFGGNAALAGILLSNVCSLAAFLLLGRLVELELGERVARRTLLLYALFPTGLFFAAVYTESLFLLLSVGVFLCLRRRRWLLAGALIALATLTRVQGALLLLPLVIELWRAYAPDFVAAWPTQHGAQRLRRTAQVALTLVGSAAPALLALLAFQLYLAHTYGVANAMSRSQNAPERQHYLDWPWVGVVSDIATLVAGGHATPTLEILKDLLFLALWLGLCVIMLLPARWRRWPSIPLSWIAYSWVSLAPILLEPAHIRGGGLMSVPRYLLVVFPCLALLALLGVRSPRAQRITIALCVAWTIILTRLLAGGMFVA